MQQGRKILMFRTHYDVMLGPRAAKAYMVTAPDMRSYEMEAYMNKAETGIHVSITRNKKREFHFVPMANIEAIQFFPEEPVQVVTKVAGNSKTKTAQAQA